MYVEGSSFRSFLEENDELDKRIEEHLSDYNRHSVLPSLETLVSEFDGYRHFFKCCDRFSAESKEYRIRVFTDRFSAAIKRRG